MLQIECLRRSDNNQALPLLIPKLILDLGFGIIWSFRRLGWQFTTVRLLNTHL